MTNYILDRDLEIKGDLIVNGNLINIMSEEDYNNYEKKNFKSINDLIGTLEIYENNLEIENDLICICYGTMPKIIVNGSVITTNTITV